MREKKWAGHFNGSAAIFATTVLLFYVIHQGHCQSKIRFLLVTDMILRIKFGPAQWVILPAF